MHLMLIGRRAPSLPISTLRANGLLTEIRCKGNLHKTTLDQIATENPADSSWYRGQMTEVELPLFLIGY
jgi:hypothetical protein